MRAVKDGPDGDPRAEDPRALVIRGLTKEYRPGQPVLKGIDLVVPGTGLTAIIGPSGTGKSTLIRCINRLVQPTAGRSCSAARTSPGSPAPPCAGRAAGSGWCSRSTTWSSASR